LDNYAKMYLLIGVLPNMLTVDTEQVDDMVTGRMQNK